MELARVFAGRCGLVLGGLGLALGRAPVRGHRAHDRTEGGSRRRRGATAPSGLATARSGGRSPSTAPLLGDFGPRCARRRGGGGCPSRTSRDRAVVVRAAIRRRGRLGGTLRLLRGDGAAGVWPVSVGAPVTDRGVGEPRRGCSRAGEGATNSAPRPAPGGARGGAGNIGWSGPASVALPASALVPGPAPAGPWGLAAGVRSGSARELPPSWEGAGVRTASMMGGAAPPLSSREGRRVSPC